MTLERSGMVLLASSVRRDIVDILSNLPRESRERGLPGRSQGLTASELGERLGLHLTTVRFHVDQLVDAGILLATDVKEGVGRPRRRYAVSPGPVAEVERPDAYRALAELLADTMTDQLSEGVPITAEEAGERWVRRHAEDILPAANSHEPARTSGQFLAKIGGLVDMLEWWGYRTTVRTTDCGRSVAIELAHCPVRALAESHPGVACAVHRGLVRATMASMGEPDVNIGLTPLLESDLCIARVTSSTDFGLKEEQS